MSWAIEILGKVLLHSDREPAIVAKAMELGGTYAYREDRGGDSFGRLVTLTFEFEEEAAAQQAAEAIRAMGEQVEGPMPYE